MYDVFLFLSGSKHKNEFVVLGVSLAVSFF